jgi:hypothetical protein
VLGPDSVRQADGTADADAGQPELEQRNGQASDPPVDDENYLIEASQTVANSAAPPSPPGPMPGQPANARRRRLDHARRADGVQWRRRLFQQL